MGNIAYLHASYRLYLWTNSGRQTVSLLVSFAQYKHLPRACRQIQRQTRREKLATHLKSWTEQYDHLTTAYLQWQASACDSDAPPPSPPDNPAMSTMHIDAIG